MPSRSKTTTTTLVYFLLSIDLGTSTHHLQLPLRLLSDNDDDDDDDAEQHIHDREDKLSDLLNRSWFRPDTIAVGCGDGWPMPWERGKGNGEEEGKGLRTKTGRCIAMQADAVRSRRPSLREASADGGTQRVPCNVEFGEGEEELLLQVGSGGVDHEVRSPKKPPRCWSTIGKAGLGVAAVSYVAVDYLRYVKGRL